MYSVNIWFFKPPPLSGCLTGALRQPPRRKQTRPVRSSPGTANDTRRRYFNLNFDVEQKLKEPFTPRVPPNTTNQYIQSSSHIVYSIIRFYPDVCAWRIVLFRGIICEICFLVVFVPWILSANQISGGKTYQKDEDHRAREQHEKERGERLIHAFERPEVEVPYHYSERRPKRVVYGGEFFNLRRRQTVRNAVQIELSCTDGCVKR